MGICFAYPQDVTHERQPSEQSVSESNFRAQRMKLLIVDAAIVETLSQNTHRILWCGAMKQKDFVSKPDLAVHIGTLDSFGMGPVLQNLNYDFALVDESGQATEPNVLAIASSCQRLCLVGDQQQLPPQSCVELMRRSLLERLSKQHGFELVVLEEQYRMLPAIAAWPSAYFYGGRLQSMLPSPSPSAFIPGFRWPEKGPIAFLNVRNAEMCKGTSYCNLAEVEVIVTVVNTFLKAGTNANDIGIIAPYAAQCRLLREQVVGSTRIGTVDALQGQERSIIILSLVRSNNRSATGFWNEARRLNVALTRAQRGLVIVGNADFWFHSCRHFKSFLQHLYKNNMVLQVPADRVKQDLAASSEGSKTSHSRSAQDRISHSRSAQESSNSRSAQDRVHNRIRVRLPAADQKECVEDIQCFLSKLTSHQHFHMILAYMMALEEHKWRWDEMPEDIWAWDQKCWSHLCSLCRTGIEDDPGNWAYTVSVTVLAATYKNIDETWRLARFADRKQLFDEQGVCRSNEENLVNAAGDIIECIGGAVTWDAPAARTFCEYYGIQEDSAKELLSFLSVYLQKIKLFIASTEAENLGAVVEELLNSMMKLGTWKNVKSKRISPFCLLVKFVASMKYILSYEMRF